MALDESGKRIVVLLFGNCFSRSANEEASKLVYDTSL